VASWLDEVNACMYAVVHNVDTVDLVLGVEIGIKALFNVLNYRAPRYVIVDKVSESRSVDDGQTETHAVFFDIGADGLYGDGLGADVEAWGLSFFRGVKRGVEEGVYECRLSEAGFTW
jgi:hypothetical protein